jgi:hypothetical protein
MAHSELPYRFPKQADVIHEQAVRFRRLSPTARGLAIVDLIASGRRLMAESPKREFAARQRAAQEEEWPRAQKELFARHGC